ncbi:periplasmic heavy metal sensor [Gymnodinialimonas ceratoperidinii]|uniref:Periplasmic heavy metal sensor n=1 Tax=Gymnodinialimonas ceratoperidinii TaxID=2856823 RepID=A0A8F6YBW1_9RHOB|nr:periplasmic heavy metal sensor [Gymnodinialimonas ceratoperidinii]QXT40958.1 periplasmic heavy metal sensor [Gymnodinialimonas ceratoperidinii]
MSESVKPRSPRWLKILLALSLALNLAVAGMVAGAYLRADPAGNRGGNGIALRTLGLGPFAQALSSEDREELSQRVQAAGIEVREERRAVGHALRRIEQALRADPFDRAGAEAALESSRELVIALQASGHAALLDQIDTMDAAERAELADSFARVMRRHGPRR